MLSRSSTSPQSDLKSIVESTAAILFLGTPHRGSPEFAAAGDWARSLLSSIGVETTPVILHALGLRTTDLERAQESFSTLWQRYDFRVKTFQEGLGLTGIKFGVLGKKVVPDYSSSLGDEREHAETIQANHRDMCRFTGTDDPGYRKVSGELSAIYASIEKGLARRSPLTERSNILHFDAEAESGVNRNFRKTLYSANSIEIRGAAMEGLTDAEEAYLRSLWFAGMYRHRQTIKPPARNTCLWLFDNDIYQNWITGTNREFSNGFLRLKGKPGSGKSVLMKEAYRKALQMTRSQGHPFLAAFFFNTKGSEMERSRAGCLRSLLHQLLPQDREYLSKLVEASKTAANTSTPDWTVQELEATLRSFIFRRKECRDLFIFVDGVDECDDSGMHILSLFWRVFTMETHHQGINLNVLISCRNANATHFENCPDISVDIYNKADISTYVESRFRLGIATEDPAWFRLREAVLEKCSGVFLWVVLVVDGLIEKWEQGEGVRALLGHLDELPQELDDLFSRLFISLTPDMKDHTWRLFSWAALSTRPLRLHEWHHVLAFIRDPAPTSLQEWQNSEHFTGNDGQLERKIRQLSRGLLEVAGGEAEPFFDTAEDIASARAGAGSFELGYGETRVVQLIHGSVRPFFLDKLSPPVTMETCLAYLHIAELDVLVSARRRAAEKRRGKLNPEFGSALKHTRARIEASRDTKLSREALEKGGGIGDTGTFTELDVREWIQSVAGAVALASDNDGDGNDDVNLASFSGQPSHASPSVRSQVLEAYPALLSYAVDEFFSHARAARQLGVDLKHIFTRLGDQPTWDRWLALSEDDAESDFDRYMYLKGLHGSHSIQGNADPLLTLCLPILQDASIEDEDKTDRLEELLRDKTNLSGQALENAILDALWWYRAGGGNATSPPPIRQTILRPPSPASRRGSGTPMSGSPHLGVSPLAPPGYLPTTLSRTKSSTASPGDMNLVSSLSLRRSESLDSIRGFYSAASSKGSVISFGTLNLPTTAPASPRIFPLREEGLDEMEELHIIKERPRAVDLEIPAARRNSSPRNKDENSVSDDQESSGGAELKLASSADDDFSSEDSLWGVNDDREGTSEEVNTAERNTAAASELSGH